MTLICRGTFFVYDDGEPLPRAEPRQWMIQSFHYNNVASAMLTLFAVQTTEGWPTLVFRINFLITSLIFRHFIFYH